MTTPTSLFEMGRFVPLYKNILRQSRGYFALLSTLLFLFYPLQYILEVSKKTPADFLPESSGSYYHWVGMAENYTLVSAIFSSAILLLCAFALGLRQNDYLFSKKAVDVYHALPISRSTLVLANTAVAMTMLWTPLLVSNVIIAIAALVVFGPGGVALGYLLLDTLFWMVITLSVYLIVTLVCMQTGRAFDAFLHSAAILASLPATGGLFLGMCRSFLHGFQVQDDFLRLLFYTSPILLVIDHFSVSETPNLLFSSSTLPFSRYFLQHWIVTALYFLLSAILIVLICRLYARRPSERAESATSTGPAPLFVQLVGTYIGGTLFGLLFYAVINNNSYGNRWILVFWSLIGACITFVILDVILNRGFKSLKKHLPIGAGMTGATLLALIVVLSGLFGFEHRVPAVDGVSQVEIRSNFLNDMYSLGKTDQGPNGTISQIYTGAREILLTDQAAVDLITQFHQETAALPKEEADSETRFSSRYVELGYLLKNGSSLHRYYKHYPETAGQALLPLLSNGDFVTQVDPLFALRAQDVASCTVLDNLGGNPQPLTLTREEIAQLIEAMQQDRLSMSTEDLTLPASAPLAILDITAAPAQEPDVTFADGKAFAISKNTPNTLRLLTQWEKLPEPADLSTVIAVTVERINWEGDNKRWSVFQHGLITSLNSTGPYILENEADFIGYVHKGDTHTQETVEVTADAYRYWGSQSPVVIGQLAENVRASWRGDEAAFTVTFHRRDASETISLVASPSLLSTETMDALRAGFSLS